MGNRQPVTKTKSAEHLAFEHYLRTGRRLSPKVLAKEVEYKFNPYHDPLNGRFTFAPGGPRSLSRVVISDRRGLHRRRQQNSEVTSKVETRSESARMHSARAGPIMDAAHPQESSAIPSEADIVVAASRGRIATAKRGADGGMTIGHALPTVVEFGRGLSYGLYDLGANVVTGTYHLLTTNPLTTVRSAGHVLAGGIDGILEAENIPARNLLRRAANELSNASAFEVGYGLGSVAGNAGLIMAPQLAAGRIGAVGRIGPVERAAPNLVQRLGPKGVDPLHHNANALVRDSFGNVIAHQRFVSGNMTLEEQALGFPKNTFASHTEARAVRTMELKRGGRTIITGQNPPCKVCRGAMNQAATESGAMIRYQWRQDGKTLIWNAKPKGQ